MDKLNCEVIEEWLRLRHNNAISVQTALALIKHTDAATALHQTTPPALDTILKTGSVTTQILTHYDAEAVTRDRIWLRESEHHHIIPWNDPCYPTLLKEISDPPLLLYVNGSPKVLAQPQIAIVGSRNPTPTGIAMAHEFARNLVKCGLTVTSGMAIGIDAAAHRGALSVGGSTVAVTATGLDQIYPRRHRKLATEISNQGVLVSEFPVGTPARKNHFPQRNRIISGLSFGTLVVEATARSGSLITARFSAEQGREVYAIPGSIHSPLAKGCHRLIRDGAKLVESVTDVLEELGQFLALRDAPIARPQNTPYNIEFGRLSSVMGYDPITIDVLVQRSGLTADTVSSMLLRMELDGVVESLNAGRYIRTQ